MTDHTLPPEVEEVIQEFVPRLVVDEARGVYYPRDTLRAHITAQAEEIERLNRMMVAIAEEHPQPAEMLFRERKLNETLLDMTAERDRYKALIRDGIQAFAFTRDYVQPKVDLPAIEGWSWYDWCKAAEEATRE